MVCKKMDMKMMHSEMMSMPAANMKRVIEGLQIPFQYAA
jgi:hypothetical protein